MPCLARDHGTGHWRARSTTVSRIMDWDNLRYFLELARSGTLAAAARRAGVEHTTVARRIQALEKQMGAALFAREAGGHRLTEAGRQLLPAVEAMETAVLGVERAAPAQAGAGPSGLVRVGATEGFGTLILAPHWRGSRKSTRTCPSTCWRCRACCTCRGARRTSSYRWSGRRAARSSSPSWRTTRCTCTASAIPWPAAPWWPRARTCATTRL